jgi:hypothetical protein
MSAIGLGDKRTALFPDKVGADIRDIVVAGAGNRLR